MDKPIKPNKNRRGRPKGSNSLRQILLKDLVAQLPQSAVVTIGAVWGRNLGIKFSDEDLSDLVMVQAPEKVEEETPPIRVNEVSFDED